MQLDRQAARRLAREILSFETRLWKEAVPWQAEKIRMMFLKLLLIEKLRRRRERKEETREREEARRNCQGDAKE